MDWLNIRLNRKRFLGLIIVFVAIFNFLQRSLGQTYIDNFHIFIGIWLAILLVLTKWRSNDIGMENKEFLLEFVIMFIPLIGLLSIGHFLLSKGGSANPYEYDNIVFSRSLSQKSVATMHDMESKYKPYLNNEDYVHNTEIAQGLFDICQATPSLGAVIAKNGASFGRFVLAYTGVKHENLMWTVDGKYFPFLAITTEETLELLLQGNAVNSFNMNILRGIFKTYNAEQTGRQFANNNNNTAPIDTVTYNQTVAQVPASSSSIVSNLAGMNIKKVWILVFLVISLGMMYFAPYHTVNVSKLREARICLEAVSA